MTVGQSKGLEFETVYVHPEGMSDNEKYVAFTRALANLYVVTSSAVSNPDEGRDTSKQHDPHTTITQVRSINKDIALELANLLNQYRELCASHRTEEEQLMQRITELQKSLIDASNVSTPQ